MLSPVHDSRNERAQLAKIPFFDPRFCRAFGKFGRISIVLISGLMVGVGVWWFEPWQSAYTSDERRRVWFAVGLLPFGGFLAASYVVEYAFKAAHVAFLLCSSRREIGTKARFLGSLTAVLLIFGIGSCSVGGDFFEWGVLALFFAAFIGYAFVTHTWSTFDRCPTKR